MSSHGGIDSKSRFDPHFIYIYLKKYRIKPCKPCFVTLKQDQYPPTCINAQWEFNIFKGAKPGLKFVN